MSIRKSPKDFLMGCDPEFVMQQGKTIIDAVGYCHRDYDESCGCDGAEVAFEARPDPAYDPLELTASIRQLFIQKIKRFPVTQSFEWRAGSFVFSSDQDDEGGIPIGGHIHFGIKDSIHHADAAQGLSEYLGACCLLLEDKKEGRKRREGPDGYGGYIDYREQSYGFEYRSASSWLTSPYITAAILCLGRVVMYEMINRIKFEIPGRFDADIFVSSDYPSVRAEFPALWKEITNMALFPQYKDYLDIIPFLINKNLTWYPKVSMKDAWGISHISQILPSPLTCKDVWHDYQPET